MKPTRRRPQYAAMRRGGQRPATNCICGCWRRWMKQGWPPACKARISTVVDAARQPVKPVAPDLPVYMAITLFVSLWLAVGGAFLMESIDPSSHSSAGRAVLALLAVALAGAAFTSQAPTPSTLACPREWFGCPLRRIRAFCPIPRRRRQPGTSRRRQASVQPMAGIQSATPMPAPIAPGDFLDVSGVSHAGVPFHGARISNGHGDAAHGA